MNKQTKEVIQEVVVSIEGSQVFDYSINNGIIQFEVSLLGEYILNITAPDFISKRIPNSLYA
ncbi:hypothetical protein [Maribacter sp. HTCC2170]|uniref:hypothetical protein n=1 Tax=Maribacter sp. (strain HTCC2170 / KCCM 42371) TaxID=313603 RepID=UPI00006BD3F7|nr:hypothetical protein [Maribacter sp. HTCC2170]EAR03053.1 hypothetical protein FB2170_07180 [Maribacter sp. HTCC2170]